MTPQDIIDAILNLTDYEREQFFAQLKDEFCVWCGRDKDQHCSCEDDE